MSYLPFPQKGQNIYNEQAIKPMSQKICDMSRAEYIKKQQQLEDQMDYQFIQRIIQEVTQSCALPFPLPASAIPPLIMQAFSYFIENYDFALEQRYLGIRNVDFCRCEGNNVITLPDRIVSIYGVYKTTDVFKYGALGDFSIERMLINNSVLSSGMGGQVTDVFGNGTGYNLTDVMGALYEIQTYKSMLEAPLTFHYNSYSHNLAILGALGNSDLIIECFIRCRLQDLYGLYYFFRYCVCLALRSLATIMGSFEFKLPGGVTINYQRFHDMAMEEMQQIDEWINKQHGADYMFNSNSI